MTARCSQESLRSRFNGPVSSEIANAWFRTAVTIRPPSCWVADVAGEVVAVGSACRHGDDVEVAVLVEDRWQRRGIGCALLCTMVDTERQLGATQLLATLAADRLTIARAMARRLSSPLSCSVAWGEAEVVADLGDAEAELGPQRWRREKAPFAGAASPGLSVR